MTQLYENLKKWARPALFGCFLTVFWLYTAVLLNSLLAIRGYTGFFRTLLCALITVSAALFCLGTWRLRSRRQQYNRLLTRKAQAGAQVLFNLEAQQALEAVVHALDREDLILLAVHPGIALFDTPQGVLGFGLLHLPKGSLTGPETLCALHRLGKGYGCRAVAAAPLFDIAPNATLCAAALADPPVYMRTQAQFAETFARFAPDPLPQPRPLTFARARSQGKLFFRTGAAMVLFSLLLRTLLVPGLMLTLFGVFLAVMGQEDANWPL